MKIGIDARIWGTKYGGVGRYVENLVENLFKIDKENNYVVFCRKDDYPFIPEGKNWKRVVAEVPHYSLREQFVMPFIFLKEKLDVLFVPHFNVPIFYNRPFAVTIHDLLWHEKRYFEDSTHNLLVWLVKYLGYRLVVRMAILRSKKIFVPTSFVARDIVRRFKVDKDKFVVSYGAGLEQLKIQNTSFFFERAKLKIRKPYILYVGSLAPHKNVLRLIDAFVLLKKYADCRDMSLIIAGGKDRRLGDLGERVSALKLDKWVLTSGFIDDSGLDYLYKNSEALVFPTLYEGFGMPGLEAMAYGVPVVCSDIEVFREVYGEAVFYFDPLDPEDMAEKIHAVLSDKKRAYQLVNKGKTRVKLYSWENMAERVLGVMTSI